MKYLILISSLIALACVQDEDVDPTPSRQELIQNLKEGQQKPECPKFHTDRIVPIVYGYPSEEMFTKSDSGLIVLGGCELGDDQYFCKIHKIGF